RGDGAATHPGGHGGGSRFCGGARNGGGWGGPFRGPPRYSADGMTNRRIFYGWWVVAAFSVTTFTSTGIRHAVGPFLKPIVTDLGLDRASFSLVIALSLFLYGVFMPLAGLALDRFSVRVVSSVGTVLLAISLVL